MPRNVLSSASFLALGALTGAPHNGSCDGNSLYDSGSLFGASLGLGDVHGLNCSYLAAILVDWNNNKRPGLGPVKFACATDIRTSARHCTRGKTSFDFILLA